jgi:hypothetical protein
MPKGARTHFARAVLSLRALLGTPSTAAARRTAARRRSVRCVFSSPLDADDWKNHDWRSDCFNGNADGAPGRAPLVRKSDHCTHGCPSAAMTAAMRVP